MKFYLLDRISKINIGKCIEGIKCWSLSDEIFEDHFPGFPIVPGVFQIETMAQLLGILIEKKLPESFAGRKGRRLGCPKHGTQSEVPQIYCSRRVSNCSGYLKLNR